MLRSRRIAKKELAKANLDFSDFQAVDLYDLNFSGRSLRFANFAGSRLYDIDFSGADLTGANFTNARLADCDFRKTNLDRVTFLWTVYAGKVRFDHEVRWEWPHFVTFGPDQDLTGVNAFAAFEYGTDLSGSNFKSGSFRESCFELADLSHANLDFADFTGSDFGGANLSHSSLVGTKLEGASIRGANLSFVDLTHTKLNLTNYDDQTTWPEGIAPLETEAIWIGEKANLENVYLRGAFLNHANLTGANLAHANLRRAILFGANFSKANLEGAKMHQAIYDKETIWPDGFDPARSGAIRRP